ncbi:MAG: hypothetical protein U9R48_11565 [Chloroflexota bacterium]|nr:hypothetical protein [Chloroflexota bacterium]
MQRASLTILRIVGSPYTTLALLILSLILGLFVGIEALVKRKPYTAGVSYIQRIAAFNETAALLPYTQADGNLGLPSRALLATLIALCALRAAHELVPHWQLPVPSHRLAHTEEFTLEGDIEEAWERATGILSAAGYHLIPAAGSKDAKRSTAHTRGAGRWFLGSLYVGLCLLFVAPLLRWRWGWHSPPLYLSLGETHSVERADIDVTLDQIAFVPRADGTARTFDARMRVEDAGNDDYLTIGLDRGARYCGTSFYYLGYGPAVRVSAWDEQGTPLDIEQIASGAPPQHALRVRFREEQQERLLSIPESDLILRLVSYRAIPSQNIKGRALQIQALRGRTGHVIAGKMLTESGSIRVADTIVDARFEYYAIVGAEHEPELAAAILGGALTLLGLYGTIMWEPHRMWVTMKAREGRCHHRLTVLKRHAEAPWFLSARAKLQEAGGHDDG